MKIEIEPKINEYYIVTVDREEYEWTFKLNDGAIGKEPWVTIDKWCMQAFGEQGMWGGPNSTWKRMGPSYYFQTNEDRAYFVLGMA
jgi:hypothetical protein